MNSILNYKDLLRWLAYIAAQVLVLNGLDYLHMATPFLFILFIIDLTTDVNRIQLLFIAFITGLVVDIFSSTPGLHCFACVLIAYLKRWISKAFGPSDTSAITPSFRTFGNTRYLQYALVMVLIHHTLYYFMENGSFNNLPTVLLKDVEAVFLTMILIFSIEYFKFKQSVNENK